MNSSSMTIPEILSDIQTIQNDITLFEELNFDRRANAIDHIEFHIIDRIEGLLQNEGDQELKQLKQQAVSIKFELETIDNNLFKKLREKIREGAYTGSSFRKMVLNYTRYNVDDIGLSGYDNLDLFMNGLLSNETIPEPELQPKAEMVFYQKTPARVIFELIKVAQLTCDDVFFDIGSGLGQVPVLVNLLSCAVAKGIEYDPAYHKYATGCATRLNLTNVEFINADARNTDISGGTVFFMYTPFEGTMLQEMLDLLKNGPRRNIIRIYSYGPCSPHMGMQGWLECKNGKGDNIYKLYEFVSKL